MSGHASLFSIVAFSILILVTPFAFAEEEKPRQSAKAPAKSHYHLFNPTPRELMREMSTDRPDRTESAYTVDAGHFQVEMSFFDFAYDHDTSDGADVVSEAWAVPPINFKVGLLNNVDLQIIFDNYLYERIEDRDPDRDPSTHDGTKEIRSGFGDMQVRTKINLWGNDGGVTALAVMPYIKFPTNTNGLGNDSVEGGIIVPLAVALPWDWSMGAQTEYDLVRNEEEDGYHAEFVNSITFSHDIIGNLAGYVEFFSMVSSRSKDAWVGTVDVGLTYAVTENIQFDCGCNFGVTPGADDFNPFAGISVRF